MLNTHVEHAAIDHACLTNEEEYDIAVLNRVIEGSNAQKISDKEWEELVILVDAAPKMLAILKDLNAYEDDRPAEGTRGAEIYHDVEELLALFTS
jgi:hypothetical protein